MDITLVTLILFGCVFTLIFLGFPIGFALGGTAVAGTFFLWGPHALSMLGFNVLANWTNTILMAMPLFFFLATLLQHSGIANELYETIYIWMGGLRGGLAMGTVVICTIFAAISGTTTTGVITMGLVALPSMLKHGYSSSIAIGCIGVGGALGMLIPPSIIMILYGYMARESVGRLWFAGFMPGLLCSSLFIVYIGIRSYFQPQLGPPLPLSERRTLREKLSATRAAVAPITIILLILGVIYLGICTPTEAGAIGVLGMLIVMAGMGKFTWKTLRPSLYSAFTLTAMSFWLLLGVTCFNALYVAMGARTLVAEALAVVALSPQTIVIAMMVIVFFMGMMLDDFAIVLLCVPVFVPIIRDLGIDSIWFAILFMMGVQMAFNTPPYGFCLFFLRIVVPKDITMGAIYRSVIPFVALQAVGLALVFKFPQIALWLPNMMIKK